MNISVTAFTILTILASGAFLLLTADAAPERLNGKKQFRFGKLTRKDILPLVLITVLYAVLAFFGLGDRQGITSWYHFTSAGDTAVISVPEGSEIGRVQYYTGATVGDYVLEWSYDGQFWEGGETLRQGYADILKWQEFLPEAPLTGVKALRITAMHHDLLLGEICLRDPAGYYIPVRCGELTDEQGLVPWEESYRNSSYFDEIYHARTAWEHLENRWPYEITHPPLGKIIIGLGIRLFGMVPFGWRFTGVLFGVLMLPLLYLLLKRMLDNTKVAACITIVFALDFMHYTQTRISTIDTYGVFWTLLMYLFFYRYFMQPLDTPLPKTLPPLLLSGLCFGLGAATKWTCIFGGAGLAVLWLVKQVERMVYARKNGLTGQVGRYLLPTVGWSCIAFLLLPIFCYLLAYIPYGRAAGARFLSADYVNVILDNIKYMYNYHSGLDATHPYQSMWWQWLLDLRPILYYLHYSADGATKSAFGAGGNPLFWWTGLGAMVCMAVKGVKGDRGAWFILAGYLSTLLPWVTVTRCAFAYHYFPCTIFLALALGRLCRDYARRSDGKGFPVAECLAYGCAILFVIFYPALSGVEYPVKYGNLLLNWFNGMWPY